MGSAAPNDASAEPIQAASVPLQSSTDAPGGIGPEFVAVIMAATAGTRLFPLTSEGDDEHGGMSDDDDDDFDALPQEPDSEEEGEDGGNDVEMKGGDDAAASASRGDDDDPTVPKHLLPVAGTSILRHLLGSVASAGFSRCIVAVGASDNGLTAKSILSEEAAATAAGSSSGVGGSSISRVSDHVLRMAVGGSSASGGGKKSKASATSAGKSMDISIVTLGVNCGGSADAVRHLSSAGAVPANSHLVVLPGDLVLASSLGDGSSLRLLADAHRRGQQKREGASASFAPPACTLLLSDVGDEDENGIPLKESAKVRQRGRNETYIYTYICYVHLHCDFAFEHIFQSCVNWQALFSS